MAPFDDPACDASGNASPLITLLKTITANCSLQQDQIRANNDNEPVQTMRSPHPEAFMQLTAIDRQLQLNQVPTLNDNKFRQIVPSPPQQLPPQTLEQEQALIHNRALPRYAMYAAQQQATSLQRDAMGGVQTTDHQEQEQVALETAWHRASATNQPIPFAEQYAEINDLKTRTRKTAAVWTAVPLRTIHQALWSCPMIPPQTSQYPMQYFPESFRIHLPKEKQVVEGEVDEELQREVEGLELKAKL